jgi:SsrA-binding protein
MAGGSHRPPRSKSVRPGRTDAKDQKVVADNRRARFDYAIIDTFEAGIELLGSEVKSLREGRANIGDSYASVEDGQLWLINGFIPEFKMANQFNHEPRRKRKLLLHRRQIDKLSSGVLREGLTVVPLKIFFNPAGFAKVDLALAKGKKGHDKRETDKARAWQRDKARVMRERG